jgi:class 3 adenylate cyclase/tetratricopeptide (TPR) repeat protein
MKKTLVLFLLILSTPIYGQLNVDSIWNIWKDESKPDSIRLSNLVYYYKNDLLYNNIDSALTLANLQLEYAKKKNYRKEIASAINNIGIIYYFKSDKDKALEYFNKAVSLYKENNEPEKAAGTYTNMGVIYKTKGDYLKALESYKLALKNTKADEYELIGANNTNIGNVYSMQNDYIRAIDYLEIGLKNHKLAKNDRGVANTLSSIGTVYYEKGEYEKAIDYQHKALEIRRKLTSKREIATTYSDLGNIYSDKGDNKKAFEYYNKGLLLSREVKDISSEGYFLNNIAMLFKDKREFEKSLKYLNESYAISTKIEKSDLIAMNLVNFGSLYSAMGDYSKSEKYLKEAIELCEELNALSYMQSAYFTLYENSVKQKDYKSALDYYEKINVLGDSLKTDETYRKLQQMEFRNEMIADSLEYVKREAIKDLEIANKQAALDIQNYLIIGIVLILILISVIAYVIFKGKKTSDALLQNILPAEVAEELKRKGYSEAKEFEKATILFSDFKDFSKICNDLSASELVSEIDYFFKKFDKITEKYGLEKIKTIGDSYMAAGGINKDSTESVVNTVLAGIEMQEVVKEHVSSTLTKSSKDFEMRVGLHTGPVIAGIVGIKKFQYDLWGETVNTASRMESYGVVSEVNISEYTYELIKDSDKFTFEQRSEVNVKSLGDIEMYLVKKI